MGERTAVDEFERRLERVHAAEGPEDTSPIPWFAEKIGRSEGCVYNWTSDHTPVPKYAVTVLQLMEIVVDGVDLGERDDSLAKWAEAKLELIRRTRRELERTANAALTALEEAEGRLELLSERPHSHQEELFGVREENERETEAIKRKAE